MIYERGNVWWYEFVFKGERIRESTHQGNGRVARQMEAARKTQLAKGEVGIKELKRAPGLANFMRNSFIPHLETTKSGKPNTIAFYKACIANLLAWPKLAESRLDEIEADTVTAYAARRAGAGKSVATVNRELATLRRALRLAKKWGDLATAPPEITLNKGERSRERVLTTEEESAYLSAAEPLLRSVATIMLDCGLRPDEVYRLRWRENYRDGRITIHEGKTKAARRSVPVTPRVAAVIEMRRAGNSSPWIFAAPTKTGHIDQSSIKKAHRRALKASEVASFVVYDLRHTCLTRWARHMDPFTLKKLAGHESLDTTMRYIHLNERDSETRLLEAREKLAHEQDAVKTPHNPPHTVKAKAS
jgi:integrase